MNNHLDQKDSELLQERIANRNKIAGPRIGDFVIMLDDTERRFTHDWGNEIQTTVGPKHPCYGDSSMHLFKNGYAQFSGSLDRAIAKSALVDTGEVKDGHFWFFHHDWATAHNGVHVMAPCRVFKQARV